MKSGEIGKEGVFPGVARLPPPVERLPKNGCSILVQYYGGEISYIAVGIGTPEGAQRAAHMLITVAGDLRDLARSLNGEA